MTVGMVPRLTVGGEILDISGAEAVGTNPNIHADSEGMDSKKRREKV